MYSLYGKCYLVDDAVLTNDYDLTNALILLTEPQDQFSANLLRGRAMTMDSLDPGDTDGDTNSSGGSNVSFTSVTYSSNAFWIEVPTNSLAATNVFSVVLHNTEENESYDLLTSTPFDAP